jgi:hypothetical protein
MPRALNAAVPVTCVHVAPSLELHTSLKILVTPNPPMTHIWLLNTTLVWFHLGGNAALAVASTHCDPETGVAVGWGDVGLCVRVHADIKNNALNITGTTTAKIFFIFNSSLFFI